MKILRLILQVEKCIINMIFIQNFNETVEHAFIRKTEKKYFYSINCILINV